MTTEVAAADLQAASGDLGMLDPRTTAEPEPQIDPTSPVIT
jgi:hypothetical protein